MDKYNVTIQFAYMSIILDNVSQETVNTMRSDLSAGRHFAVRQGESVFTINPTEVNYLEVRPQ